jgi:hypothetical protein
MPVRVARKILPSRWGYGKTNASITRHSRAWVLVVCAALQVACGPSIPYVQHFRQLPGPANAQWLSGQPLVLEPFVAGSIHTPTALNALPAQFQRQFPDTMTFRPLWARERDAAKFLHSEISRALERRARSRQTNLVLLPGPTDAEQEYAYHASGHLELGVFRPVLFDLRAEHLGDASAGNDRFTPFRKAFLVAKQPPPGNGLRIVTGYLGLHCAHELVGRANADKASTSIDWLLALVDAGGNIVAQAYIGAASERWRCPVAGEDWRDLTNSLTDQLIDSVLWPVQRA